MTRIRFRVDITPGCSIGPGKVSLLESIGETGSLSAAARGLGMSYRRAWLLLDSLNRSFRRPLTAASVGGRGGGGVELTDLGREVIAEYRRMEADLDRLAARRWKSVGRLARPDSGARAGRSVRLKSPGAPLRARGRGSRPP